MIGHAASFNSPALQVIVGFGLIFLTTRLLLCGAVARRHLDANLRGGFYLLALLYKDRDVSIRFIKMLAHDVKEKEQHLLQLAYASVRQRVAQSLLRVHDRYAGGAEAGLGLKISREDLSTVVGTATESLIRCLTDLKEEGLIDSQGRDIRIKDRVRLEKLAQR